MGGHFPATRHRRRRQLHPKFSTPHVALPEKELRVGESGGSLPMKRRLAVPTPSPLLCALDNNHQLSLGLAH